MSKNIKSAAWSVALFWARFGVNAVVFLIIARWIPTEEVGAYGAIFAIIQLLQAVQLFGLPEAVIRSEQPGSTDTAFWLSLAFGLLASAGLWLAAPVFGRFMGEAAQHYARYLALVPLLIGLGAVSEASLRRDLKIDRLAIRTTFTLSLAGIVTIVMASRGWGGWSLIAFTLISNLLTSLLNIWLSPWKPGWRCDLRQLPQLLRDIMAISASNLLKASITPVSQFIVTGTLGLAAGGIYLIAVRFSGILFSLTMMPAQYVALPVFTKFRDDPQRRSRAFIESCAVMSVIATPIYIGIAAISPQLLPLLLGETGAEVVPVAQGFLFHSPVMILANLGLPVLISMGFAASAVRFTGLQAAANFPVTWLAGTISLAAVSWSFGLLYYAIAPLLLLSLCRHAGIGILPLLAALFRPWAAALIAAALVMALPLLLPHSTGLLALLTLQIALGALLYLGALWLVARPAMRLAIATFKDLISRKAGAKRK